MFERRIQTANYFRGRFEQRLRFRFGYLVDVAAQMIDQLAEFFPNISGMRSRILLMQSFPYNGFACGITCRRI